MSSKGFTLIEVLVGITLIAVVLTLLLNFLLKSSQQITVINHKLVANNLARWKLEENLEHDASSIVTTSFKKFSSPKYNKYWYRVISTQVNSNLKRVIVEVKDQQKVWAKLITHKAEEN